MYLLLKSISSNNIRYFLGFRIQTNNLDVACHRPDSDRKLLQDPLIGGFSSNQLQYFQDFQNVMEAFALLDNYY